MEEQRGDIPTQILLPEHRRRRVGRQPPAIRISHDERHQQKERPDQDGEHQRLVEQKLRVVTILASERVRDQRGRPHAQRLRQREHEEGQIPRHPHAGDRLLSQPADEIEIHEQVQRLEHRAQRDERRHPEDVSENRAARHVLHDSRDRYLYATAALEAPASLTTSKRVKPASPHQPLKSAPV